MLMAVLVGDDQSPVMMKLLKGGLKDLGLFDIALGQGETFLSFPGEEPGWLGDLVLSVDTLARETFLYNQDLHQYTIRLLAHGFLHLLGHDHGLEMDSLTDLAVLSLAQEDPYVMP